MYYLGLTSALSSATVDHLAEQNYQRSSRTSLDGSITSIHCNAPSGVCSTFAADPALTRYATIELVNAQLIPDSDWNE